MDFRLEVNGAVIQPLSLSLQELRQQYQIVFHSEADVPDQWRSLLVRSSAGHNLRAPRGYFP